MGIGVAILCGVIFADVFVLAAQEAILGIGGLERGADLRETGLTFTFDLATVCIGLAGMCTVSAFDAVHTNDRATELFMSNAGIALRGCVTGLPGVFIAVVAAGYDPHHQPQRNKHMNFRHTAV